MPGLSCLAACLQSFNTSEVLRCPRQLVADLHSGQQDAALPAATGGDSDRYRLKFFEVGNHHAFVYSL